MGIAPFGKIGTMKAEIKLIVSQEELSNYCTSYYEENGEFPSMEDVRQNFVDWFVVDHNDYIEYNNIKLAIRFASGKEVEP